MDNKDITPDTLPDEGGEGAVDTTEETSDVVSKKETMEALSLEDLNKHLGKDFKTKDAALKALKDTFSYVGKKEENVEKELREKGFMTREELENEFFFRDNPQHSGNQDILRAIAKDQGISLAKAAQTESYKKLYEASAKYEEFQSSQSVMDSNPRIAEQKERLEGVRELALKDKDAAAQEAARIVLDSLQG